ncbi:MAG: hypothetical protein Q9168_006270, partial [Polycauliona sp. 1 TL-2023]
MAQMGEKLIEFLLAETAYAAGASRDFLSNQALQESSYNLLRLDQPNTGDMLCSSAGFESSANDAALSSLVGFDTIETRQRDISDNEADEQMWPEGPFREPNLCSFATSPCLSAMELDTRVLTSVEANTSHPEALREESSQQPQEGEENETRPSNLNRPTSSIAGSLEDASCAASRSQLRTARTTHETRRHRIGKSAQSCRSSRKPAQSMRKLVRRDNRHETSPEKSSGEEEDKEEASAEQDTSDNSACILRGKRRCESLGYGDTNLLGSEQGKRLLASVSSDKQVLVLRSLLVAVGGCDSLMSLKNILQAYRESHKSNSPAHANISSNAQRIEMIKRLGEKAAYYTFLKHCHIHKLFIDNSRLRRNATDNFINSNATSIAARSSRGRGNPVTSMEAQITKSMMRELYSDIQPTHPHYKSRYREISDWRRAGRRLEQLVSGFNYGILGLLPLMKYNLNLVENT